MELWCSPTLYAYIFSRLYNTLLYVYINACVKWIYGILKKCTSHTSESHAIYNYNDHDKIIHGGPQIIHLSVTSLCNAASEYIMSKIVRWLTPPPLVKSKIRQLCLVNFYANPTRCHL